MRCFWACVCVGFGDEGVLFVLGLIGEVDVFVVCG